MSNIGHNSKASTFDVCAEAIDTVMTEARNWLDGEPIASDDQAEAVERLLSDAHEIWKAADDARKAEKKPHADAAKAVDDNWREMIADAKSAKDGCTSLLTPWKAKKAAAHAAKVEAERRKAKEAEEAAEKARAAVDPTDLASKAEAEVVTLEAQRAARKAKAIAKDGVKGLVTRYEGVIVDLNAYLRHLYDTRLPDLREFAESQMRSEVAAGKRNIPGVEVSQTQKARA